MRVPLGTKRVFFTTYTPYGKYEILQLFAFACNIALSEAESSVEPSPLTLVFVNGSDQDFIIGEQSLRVPRNSLHVDKLIASILSVCRLRNSEKFAIGQQAS